MITLFIWLYFHLLFTCRHPHRLCIYTAPQIEAAYLAGQSTARCYSLLLSLPASCKSRYYANNIALYLHSNLML